VDSSDIGRLEVNIYFGADSGGVSLKSGLFYFYSKKFYTNRTIMQSGVRMVVGVTMINVVPGTEKEVYRNIRDMEGVREIYHVFGEYDFVAIIEVDGLSHLNKVVDAIREVKGVTATHTVVGAEL
jgi:DNA-binding Lrp family transcriptional regulator